MRRGARLFSLAVSLTFAVGCGTGCSGLVSGVSEDGGRSESSPEQQDDPAGMVILPDGGRRQLDASVLLDGRVISGPATGDTGTSGGDATVVVGADSCPAGSPRALNRVRFFPAKGKAAALVGGVFQGSNTSETNDFVDLGKIESAPEDGTYTELTFTNSTVYRYIKYYSPEGSSGSIAELELYHDDTKLSGAGFGTASGNGSFALALDGKTDTEFNGTLADGNYVGLDIGRDSLAQTPTFSPEAGTLMSASDVAISSGTAGAKIRYTLDGTNPTASVGTPYSGPFNVSSRVTIKAIASADCLFDSQIAQAAYSVGSAPAPSTKGFKSYHIGNSLTDTINPWLEPIADSTGVDHTFARWTIPGAPIGYIWEHKGDGIGTPQAAADFDSWVKSYAPIDHLTVQPFADPNMLQQGGAAVGMINGVRADSPNVQPWVYAQWASARDWQRDLFANGEPSATPPWNVPSQPTDWASATQNQMLYYAAFAKYLDDRTEGKSVLVIPVGLAVVELKRRIESGAMPGVSDFFAYAFQDDLHLTPPVQYLAALVFYSCFYKQTPEGRSKTPTELKLSDAQAKLLQRIAWEVASSYPLSGIGTP